MHIVADRLFPCLAGVVVACVLGMFGGHRVALQGKATVMAQLSTPAARTLLAQTSR